MMTAVSSYFSKSKTNPLDNEGKCELKIDQTYKVMADE